MQVLRVGPAATRVSFRESALVGASKELWSHGDGNGSCSGCGGFSLKLLSSAGIRAGAASLRLHGFRVQSSVTTEPTERSFLSAEQKVFEVVAKQAAMVDEQQRRSGSPWQDVRLDLTTAGGAMELLEEAYVRCGEVCAEYAKTFYLGTKLMTPERQRAIWAIYVWCRRTDELVDGPNASRITPTALDRWEDRLEDVFRGQPYDMLDAALSDTVNKFPVDIQCATGESLSTTG